MSFKGYLIILVFCSSCMYSSDPQTELVKSYLALSIVALVHDKNSNYSAVDQVNMQMYQLENVRIYLEEKRKREILKTYLNHYLRQINKTGNDVKASKKVIRKLVEPYQRTGGGKHIIDSQDFKNMYRLFYSKHALRSNYGDESAYWLWPSRLQQQDIPNCVNKCKDMIKSEIVKIDAHDDDCRMKLSELGVIVDQEVVHRRVIPVNGSEL